jgi:Fur family transcriptional regulator, peroxide stress response regulator
MIFPIMTDPHSRYQTMLARLKARGGRLTSQRLALLQLLSVSKGHPNAAQLYAQLQVQFPAISLATVYKTLTLLKEEGEVFEIELGSERHYDGNKPYPHPHLICQQCEKIMDGEEINRLDVVLQEIHERYDFEVLQSQLVFYGVCRDCRQEA